MASFGERLRELRKEKGLLQRELAERLNLSRVAITQYENGNRVPDQEIINKIADYFGVSLDYLMGKTDIRNPYVPQLTKKDDKKYALELLKKVLKDKRGSIDLRNLFNKKEKSNFPNAIIEEIEYDESEDISKICIQDPQPDDSITNKEDFLAQAKEKYGLRGKKQAEELLEKIQSLFDGGELPDEDKDEFFRAITEIYFESKEKNKKYTPKKYRKKSDSK